MSQDAEIKGVIPNYYNLIIDKLNRIYEAWDQNNLSLALFRTLRLIPFLPRKLKNALKPDKDRIEDQLKNSANTGGHDFDNATEKAMYRIRKVAQKEFEPLLDKLTSLLDESHLLTQSYGVPSRTGDIRKIGENLA